jgi:hypothetical protein
LDTRPTLRAAPFSLPTAIYLPSPMQCGNLLERCRIVGWILRDCCNAVSSTCIRTSAFRSVFLSVVPPISVIFHLSRGRSERLAIRLPETVIRETLSPARAERRAFHVPGGST